MIVTGPSFSMETSMWAWNRPVATLSPASPEYLDGAVHQRLRLLGRGGLSEAGAAALARAAVEGELADD